jgi:hypothetical protein
MFCRLAFAVGSWRRGTLSAVLNPLRSEAEAFRFLLYVAAVVGTITVVVVVLRAIF